MLRASDSHFMKRVFSLRQEAAGATGIEYAVISASMALALIAAMSTLGQSVSGMYSKVAVALEGSPSIPGPKVGTHATPPPVP